MQNQKEALTLLFESSKRAIPFNILLAALLALILLYNQGPILIILAWFLAIVVASVTRWIFCHYGLLEQKSNSLLIRFILLTLLMGAIWGSCYVLMLPYINESVEFIIILVFGGMSAGSITSLSACLPAYYAYVIPMFIPVIAYNYWLDTFNRTLLATMFLLYVIMVLLSSKINNQALNKIFKLSGEKELLIKELQALSVTDSLTGLYNRRHYEYMLQEELGRAKRNRYPLVLLLLDIDNFKLFNDNFGHPFGDKILIATAKWLKTVFRRANDTVYRIGGDEFSVILINQNIDEVVELCKTLNEHLNEIIPADNPNELKLLKKMSLSIGIISIPYSYPSDYVPLTTILDNLLYQAKAEGKNRLIIKDLKDESNFL